MLLKPLTDLVCPHSLHQHAVRLHWLEFSEGHLLPCRDLNRVGSFLTPCPSCYYPPRSLSAFPALHQSACLIFTGIHHLIRSSNNELSHKPRTLNLGSCQSTEDAGFTTQPLKEEITSLSSCLFCSRLQGRWNRNNLIILPSYVEWQTIQGKKLSPVSIFSVNVSAWH